MAQADLREPWISGARCGNSMARWLSRPAALIGIAAALALATPAHAEKRVSLSQAAA
jgi:hypothetical protein